MACLDLGVVIVYTWVNLWMCEFIPGAVQELKMFGIKFWLVIGGGAFVCYIL